MYFLKRSRLLQPDFPFQPRRVPVFYGWVILAVTTLGILMSIPGQTAGVSVFTDHLIAATGLSRLALSSAYLIGTLTSGLLLPFGGVFIDRFGARMVVVGATTWLALTLVYMSFSDRLAQWLGMRLALESSQGVAFGLLCIGFVSLRFSGQGMLTLVSRTTLGKWFDRRRGMASGMSGVFSSFGFSAAPLLLSFFIDGFGWRGAWLSLAVLVGIGMGAIGWLFYRDNPEECGLVMDGKADAAIGFSVGEQTQSELSALSVGPAIGSSVGTPGESGPNPNADPYSDSDEAANFPAQTGSVKRRVVMTRDFTRGEALRTLAFWAVTLALASQALTITGITFHIVDIGSAMALTEKQTVAIFLPIGIISTVTGYAIGVLSDRTQLRSLFIGMMVFQSMGIAGMAHLDSGLLRGVAIVGLGISGGCFGTLSAVTMPRYFGRRHLGAISGVEMMTLVIASAIGPSLLAVFNALFGSYRWGLYFCACVPLAVIVILVPSRNPQG